MTKIIIFDLYNTLIHSTKRSKPYLDLFQSMGLSKEEQSFWRDQVMTRNFDTFQDLAEEIRPGTHIHTEKYDYQIREENLHTFVFEDTYQVLETLSDKYRLYLLSNIATPYKECFHNLNLDRWIKEPVFSCDIGFRKPQPEAFRHVLDLAGAKPTDAVMIGDSHHSDYEGAKNAGIRPILKDRSLTEIMYLI